MELLLFPSLLTWRGGGRWKSTHPREENHMLRSGRHAALSSPVSEVVSPCQRFSRQGWKAQFCSRDRDIGQYLKTLLVDTSGGIDAAGICLVIETWDAAKHPTIHSAAPTRENHQPQLLLVLRLRSPVLCYLLSCSVTLLLGYAIKFDSVL